MLQPKCLLQENKGAIPATAKPKLGDSLNSIIQILPFVVSDEDAGKAQNVQLNLVPIAALWAGSHVVPWVIVTKAETHIMLRSVSYVPPKELTQVIQKGHLRRYL